MIESGWFMVIGGFVVIYGDDLWDTTSEVLFRPSNDGFWEGMNFIAGRKSQRFSSWWIMISQPDLVTLGPLLLLFQLDVVCVFFFLRFSQKSLKGTSEKPVFGRQNPWFHIFLTKPIRYELNAWHRTFNRGASYLLCRLMQCCFFSKGWSDVKFPHFEPRPISSPVGWY